MKFRELMQDPDCKAFYNDLLARQKNAPPEMESPA